MMEFKVVRAAKWARFSIAWDPVHWPSS